MLNKLERKIGRFAIRNLSLYLIGGYAIGYVLSFFNGAISAINLNPYLILHKGQVWRLITWALVAPTSLQFSSIFELFFTVIFLYFFYSLGSALERTWGTFRYNIYIFSGMIFTILGTFIFYLYPYLLDSVPTYEWGALIAYRISTYYVFLSTFLAFATVYPDMKIMLYFIIPIKIKWLAIVDIVILIFDFIRYDAANKVIIISSLINFLIFFLTTRNYKRISPQEIHRKTEYRKQTKEAVKIHKHKCAICGRTEDDGDHLEFRFCSKCNGNYEYCQEHLFTHKHK